MISKRIKGRKDGRSSARAALRYGEGLTVSKSRELSVRSDKSNRTRFGNFGLVDDIVLAGQDQSVMVNLIDLAALEMQANCDMNTRVTPDKKMAHFVISFNQDKPNEAVLRDTEDSMLFALGLDNNHFATFLHNDNGYWHLHLFASCIEKSFPYRCDSLWQDRRKRDKLCREIEARHGLSRDNGLHEIDKHGQVIEVPLAVRQGRSKAGLKRTDRAQTVERHSGEKTFQTWCNEVRIGDRLKLAKSWNDLHATAAAYNCEVKSKGAGFVLCPIGEKGGISLSTLGLKKLPAKMGTYIAAEKSQRIEGRASYKPEPIRSGGALYLEWHEARSQFRENKSGAFTQLRNTHASARAALREKQRSELSVIRSSSIGKERAVAVSVAKLQHAVELTALAAVHSTERSRLRHELAEAAPGTTYRDFLIKRASAGSELALEQARAYGAAESTAVSKQREAIELRVVSTVGGMLDIPARRLSFSHRIVRSGTVIFDLGQGRHLIDSAVAKQIQLNEAAAVDPSVVETSLRFATSKFGPQLTLGGPASFQKLAVEIAVNKGLGVRFVNPELDAYREKLESERERSRFIQPAKISALHRTALTEVKNVSSTPLVIPPPTPWFHLNPVDVQDAIEEFLALGLDDDGPPEPIRRAALRSEIDAITEHSYPDEHIVYADLVARSRIEGKVFDVKAGMEYVGEIKEISSCGRFAVQAQGRGAVVIHDLTKLPGRFVVGQNASITYRDGTGKDKFQASDKQPNVLSSGVAR